MKHMDNVSYGINLQWSWSDLREKKI